MKQHPYPPHAINSTAGIDPGQMRVLLALALPLAAAFAAVPTAATAPTSSSSSSSEAAKQHGTPMHRGLERRTDFVVLEEIAHDPSAFT